MTARPTDSRHLADCVYFGRRLRHWRKSAALTQADLGRLLMYDPSYISRMESGSRWPPREVAQRCDDLLGAGRELVELWAAADIERRRAEPPAAVLAGLARLLAASAEGDHAEGGCAGVASLEGHRRQLMDWIAGAPRSLVRSLMEFEAEPAPHSTTGGRRTAI
jgi:transcriptional regulator with XRE-family HTH domain